MGLADRFWQAREILMLYRTIREKEVEKYRKDSLELPRLTVS